MHSNHSYDKNNVKLELKSYTLLQHLDKFIQSCLNKFQFVLPQKELYEITGEDKNYIISHKSTIPDLVIWNKTFNKNECFEGSDLSKNNPFPRFKFFLKINKSQEKKENIRKKNCQNKNQEEMSEKTEENDGKNTCDKNVTTNSGNITNSMEKFNLNEENEEFSNTSCKIKINSSHSSHSNEKSIGVNDSNFKEKNMSYDKNDDLLLKQDKTINLIESNNNNNNDYNYHPDNRNKSQNLNLMKKSEYYYPFNYTDNNINQLTQNSSLLNNNYQFNPYYDNKYMNNNNSKKMNNIYQNKFSITSSKNKKSMTDYYQNQFKQHELLMNYVYESLQIKGWIIFKNNGNYISNFTSFELFSFLTNILKDNNDLKNFTVGMANNPMMFNGEQIYIILSQTLPIILQKKQYELMKQNEIMKKQSQENENEKHFSICEQDGFNYDFKLDKNSDGQDEENKDNECNEKEDDNYYNFDLINNINSDNTKSNSNNNECIDSNLLLNKKEENKFDNFDSSIFGQNH